MDYQTVRNKIDEVITDLLEIKKHKNNTKYVDMCFTHMLNDLHDMTAFLSAQSLKEELGIGQNESEDK
jgi:hypothetical protein